MVCIRWAFCFLTTSLFLFGMDALCIHMLLVAALSFLSCQDIPPFACRELSRFQLHFILS